MRLLASITILLAVVAKQCVSFDQVTLDDTNQIAVPEEAEKGFLMTERTEEDEEKNEEHLKELRKRAKEMENKIYGS